MTSRRRALFGALVLVVASGAAVVAVVVTRGGSPPPLPFRPAVVGGQPPGATVLAAEDRDLAVALAVRPGRTLLLVATVLGQDGRGASGRDVSFRVRTSAGQTIAAGARACAPGCYEALVPALRRPGAVTVDVRGSGAGPPLMFRLPRPWPPAPGLRLVRRAERAYAELKTLVTHERLGSSPTNVLDTTYWAQAPDRLHLKIRGGAESIIIGGTRWDRLRGGPWERSPQPPFRTVKPFWTPQVTNASVLGDAVVHGRPAWVVSFATPQVPAFFTVWIDRRTSRTLQLRMTAAAHFMVHRYGPFDAPLRIVPPPPR